MPTESQTPTQTLPAPPSNPANSHICSQCGTTVPCITHTTVLNAQTNISDLEHQVKILTLRATSAVEKATDFEEALRSITFATNSPYPPHLLSSAISTPTPTPNAASTVTPTQQQPPPVTASTRLSRLLPTRRPINPPSSAPLYPPLAQTPNPSQYTYPATAGLVAPRESELLNALTREQSLRHAAETRAEQTNDEIEELTAKLFEEANTMVATERKARAKLEEKIKILERRDKEKKERLVMLEGRLERIDRVKRMLEDETVTDRGRGREEGGGGGGGD